MIETYNFILSHFVKLPGYWFQVYGCSCLPRLFGHRVILFENICFRLCYRLGELVKCFWQSLDFFPVLIG